MRVLSFSPRKPRAGLTKKKRMILAKQQADEAQANAILRAITGNQCLPSKYELKAMINRGEWVKVGELFSFTPTFLSEGVIDWRCVPKRVYEILQCAEYKAIRLTNGDRKSATERKNQLPKTSAGLGKREFLYCNQSAQCHYCAAHVIFNRWTIDHLTPTARGGGNSLGNLVGACATCNTAKGPLTFDEFMATDYMGGTLNLKEEIKRVSALVRNQANIK